MGLLKSKLCLTTPIARGDSQSNRLNFYAPMLGYSSAIDYANGAALSGSGTLTPTPSPYGIGCQFASGAYYLANYHSTQPTNKNKLTHACWIKTTQNPGTSYWITSEASTADTQQIAGLLLLNGGYVQGLFRYEGMTDVWLSTSNGIINDGKWHHIAFTFDGSSILTYIDGALDVASTTIGQTASATNFNRIGLGCLSRASIGAGFVGTLAGVRMYDRALLQNEVQDIYVNPQKLYSISRKLFVTEKSTTNIDWYVRPDGNELNGGGFNSTISNLSVNYCDQATPVLSLTNMTTVLGLTGVTSATVNSVSNPFTPAMVGNVMRISAGTNFITGYYTIISYNSPSSVTLDRNCCTSAGSGGTCRVGGAHASLINYASGGTLPQPILSSPLAPGHRVLIRGSGVDNPLVYDYDFSAGYWTFPSGSLAGGLIKFIGYNGRPYFKTNTLFTQIGTTSCSFSNIKLQAAVSNYSNHWIFEGVGLELFNLYIDLNGFDTGAIKSASNSSGAANTIRGNYIFNSGSTATGTQSAIFAGIGTHTTNNVIINTRGSGITTDGLSIVDNNIIANCKGDGITINAGAAYVGTVKNNTIHNCSGNGIYLPDLGALRAVILNNTVSNCATGIRCSASTLTSLNDRLKCMTDYNNYYNNTNNYVYISAGPNDTSLDPQFIDPTNYNFGIGTNLRGLGYLQAFRGINTASFVDLGAVQRREYAITHSLAVRNAIANNVATATNTGSLNPTASLELLDNSNVLLVTMNFGNPAFGSASSGQITANPLASGSAVATGTASKFNIKDRDGNIILSGSVGLANSGADIILSSTSVLVTDVITITSLVYSSAP